MCFGVLFRSSINLSLIIYVRHQAQRISSPQDRIVRFRSVLRSALSNNLFSFKSQFGEKKSKFVNWKRNDRRFFLLRKWSPNDEEKRSAPFSTSPPLQRLNRWCASYPFSASFVASELNSQTTGMIARLNTNGFGSPSSGKCPTCFLRRRDWRLTVEQKSPIMRAKG